MKSIDRKVFSETKGDSRFSPRTLCESETEVNELFKVAYEVSIRLGAPPEEAEFLAEEYSRPARMRLSEHQ